MTSEERNEHLGAAAELLEHRGDLSAAALLLDVQSLSYHGHEIGWRVVDGKVTDERVYEVSVFLGCTPLIADRFTPEITESVHDTLREVAFSDHLIVQDLQIVIAPAADDWRERLEDRLGIGPTNQARVRAAGRDWPKKDGLYFRSDAEVKVYDALKRAGANLPEAQSIAIAPNAGIRVRQATWEVDFLVTHNGRAGVIEVDGPHHHGRRAPDRDRERILEDSGIAIVDRFVVEDTDDPTKIDALVRRFLDRLHG